MEEFARKLIEDHKNPIVKLETPGPKQFFKSDSNDVKELTEKHLNNIQKTLGHIRVDRRCARAQAEWCQEKYLAKVTRVIKGLVHGYGYQDRSGIYLYPEEMLFLVESNRLEMLRDGVTMTIQECYNLVLNDANCGLNNYRVYKKLVLQGYKLIRRSEIIRKITHLSESKNVSAPSECKRRKLDESPRACPGSSKISHDIIADEEDNLTRIFERIRKNAPTQFVPVSTDNINYDYGIFAPNNKSKTDCDFYLIICCDNILDKISENGNKPVIYAICEDNISFHRIAHVQLPVL